MRGGIRHKSKSKKGTTALLDALWAKFGGPAEIVKNHLPQFHRQFFVNWRLRGRVPLKYCTIIASALEVPPWGLNYEELSMISPEKIPTWKEVVKSYNLSKQQIDQILFLTPPEKYKA